MRKRYFLLLSIILGLCVVGPEPAQANPALLARGVSKVVTSVVQIPMSILQDSTQILFPLGILTGTVKGTFNMLMGILGGGLDIAAGAAPYAKYLVFFV